MPKAGAEQENREKSLWETLALHQVYCSSTEAYGLGCRTERDLPSSRTGEQRELPNGPESWKLDVNEKEVSRLWPVPRSQALLKGNILNQLFKVF